MTASPARTRPKTAWSLRRLLLTGILLPVLALIALNAWSLYQQTLASLHTAYDRTLLASAKSISEQIGVTGYDDQAQLRAIVPYSALEIFEADNQSRMFYRVSTLDGQLISGFEELPVWNGRIPQRPPYAALVDFYDDEFRGHPVRVAVLLQPVASADGRGMAVIQVAETLELRESLALQILRDTLIRQALLVLVVALIVIIVVQRATQPIRQLSQDLQGRAQGDLSPLAAPEAPREVQPCWKPPTRPCSACKAC
jgi:two-component system sensor histidine kinase TctE